MAVCIFASEYLAKPFLLLRCNDLWKFHFKGNEQITESLPVATRHALSGNSQYFVTFYDIVNRNGELLPI